MNLMNKLWLGCAAATLALTGCDKPDSEPANDGNGILTIKVKAETPSTRALLDGSTITSSLVAAFENNVANFTAYVFNWSTGDLEASAESVGGTATITGLNTAGTKRVLVIANGAGLSGSSIPAFTTSPDYASLAAGYVALADQSVPNFADLTKGFLMTGENATAIQLVAGNTNTVEIPVRRVVAKIELGDISFDGDVQLSDLAKFNLTGVSIQRAVTTSGIGTGNIAAVQSPAWTGGRIGTISTTASAELGVETLDLATFLEGLVNSLEIDGLETVAPGGLAAVADELTGTLGAAITEAPGSVNTLYQVPAFWYVLPNSNEENSTLLTLTGSYNGQNFHYPVEINTPASNPSADGGADGKGLYIRRNTIYKVNITFHNLVGTTDPDVPGMAASLTVTVTPVQWEGPVVQNTTW